MVVTGRGSTKVPHFACQAIWFVMVYPKDVPHICLHIWSAHPSVCLSTCPLAGRSVRLSASPTVHLPAGTSPPNQATHPASPSVHHPICLPICPLAGVCWPARPLADSPCVNPPVHLLVWPPIPSSQSPTCLSTRPPASPLVHSTTTPSAWCLLARPCRCGFLVNVFFVNEVSPNVVSLNVVSPCCWCPLTYPPGRRPPTHPSTRPLVRRFPMNVVSPLMWFPV